MAKGYSLQELQSMQGTGNTQKRGYSLNELQGIQPKEQVTQPQEQVTEDNFFDFGSIASSIGEGTKNLIGGAVAQVPEILSNVSKMGQKALSYIDPVNILDPEYAKKSQQKDLFATQQIGQKSKRGLQNLIGVDPEATTTKVGEFGAEVGTSLLMPGGMAAKGGQLLAKGGLGLAKKLLGFGGETLLGATTTAGISKGELPSAGDIATQGALGGVMKGIGAGGKWLYSQFIPKTEKEVVNIIASKSNLGDTVADTALQKGLRGTKTTMGQQAFKEQGKIWNKKIGPALEKSQSTISKAELLDPIKTYISNIALASERPAYMKALAKLEQDVGENISLKQAQAIKHSIDDITPNKILAGEQGNIEDMLYNQLANNIRGKISEKIGNEFGENISKHYKDYSNLYTILEMGKAALKTGKSGGALEKTITAGSSAGIIGHIISSLVTPGATGLGQITKHLNGPIGKVIKQMITTGISRSQSNKNK